MEQNRAHGYVTAYRITPEGYREFVDAGHNTLSYRCADASAALFAGEVGLRPKSIIFVCDTSDAKASMFIFDPESSTNRVQDKDTIIGTRFNSCDIVDLDPNPTRDATDETYEEMHGDVPSVTKKCYSGNRVTFTALTKKNNVDVHVYGFLLMAEDGKTVLATRKLGSPIPKSDGFALSVKWAVTFK